MESADPPAVLTTAPAGSPTGSSDAPETLPTRRWMPGWRPPTAILAVAGVVIGWIAVVLAAPLVQVGPTVQEFARFGHVAALVLGFGAALTVEWFGLMWVLRRRSLASVAQVAHGAHLPIWLGLAGLAVTGIALSPSPLTTAGIAKLIIVLVVALNGIYAGQMQRRLQAAEPHIPRSLLARAGLAGAVSQAGWWSALLIGYLSSQ